ncbi:MAG TPA: NTF2-like N-terminal transpeptidase domain-containing protein, partial [Chloroflexota bacterium]|nr:NTF2-like N-terminal transpeptidase domain-containing protein [Chloroflexota bacterium]
MRSRRSGRSALGIVLALTLTAVLVVACSRLGIANRGAPTPTEASVSPTTAPARAQGPSSATATLPPPTSAPTVALTVQPANSAPSNQVIQQAVDQYIKAWEGGKYTDLYQMLSHDAQASISQDKFVGRYTNIASGIDQTSVVVTATLPVDLTPSGNPPTVKVPITVTYNLAVLGPVTEDNTLPLVLENGQWKVAWTPGLIFKDLTADRVVRYDPVNPTRGSILDRNGNVLAEDGNILTVGIVPGEIKDEGAMLKALSDYLKMPSDSIKKLYANAQPDWFVPVKDLPDSDKTTAQQKLGNVLGVSLRERVRRVYPYGSATADFVGYVSPVEQSDLKTLGPQGYDVGDWVGRAGLESWGEKYLAGQKGATLAIVNPDGSVVRTIAQKPAVPGDTIITSVDVNYQIEANKILADKPGSIIVMNPEDN